MYGYQFATPGWVKISQSKLEKQTFVCVSASEFIITSHCVVPPQPFGNDKETKETKTPRSSASTALCGRRSQLSQLRRKSLKISHQVLKKIKHGLKKRSRNSGDGLQLALSVLEPVGDSSQVGGQLHERGHQGREEGFHVLLDGGGDVGDGARVEW
jgi:hypothetical protein